MPDPIEPTDTVAKSPDQNASVANSADETSPHAGSASPKFGPPAAPGEVGTLGPYRVVKQLGAGGMGAVYLAIDTRLDRKLALKVMLPEFAADRQAKERFLREARAAAKISHDNVVTVFEADEREGVPYIAMQFLQGYPLDDYLRTKGAPALPHIIRIGREAAAGLSAAHALGLVHRDIKPANLWLEAPNGRVKVLDFGLAKPIGSDTELTKSGAVVGTPSFMSPEQARGQKVDHRTDIFSLGAVLYRLCTGQNPFHGPNVMAVLMALGSDDPTPVRELNPNVPESLAQLIHQLLAKKPEQRPQTAAEVAKRLRAVLEQLLNPGAPASTASGSVPAVSAPDVSGSQPVVVHAIPHQPPLVAPMSVTAQPESVFANLTDENENEDATREEEYDEAPAPAPKRAGGKVGLIVGVAALVLALIAAAVIVIKIKNKDGTETEIKVPEGASIEVTKDGKSIVKVDPKGVPNPKPKADPKIIAGKWVSLSPDGVTDWSTHWEAHGAQDWKLQDGELFNSNVNRGWIGTKAEYTDFEIELEYKFGTKGNSGIFLRAWAEGEQTGGQFVEVQLIDDDAYRTTGRNCTGAIFNGVEPNPRPVSKLKEWNTARVTVVGKHVTVTINGVKCVEGAVGFSREKGVIGLQQLDSAVYFRNVRVRDLTAVAGGAFPPLDPAWVEKVRALKPDDQAKEVAAELKRRNPDFDPATLDHRVTDGILTHLTVPTDRVKDLTPVRVFPTLRMLEAVPAHPTESGRLSSLEPLRGATIEILNVSRNRITDLSPLAGMKLDTLTASSQPVEDLTPLRGSPLKNLFLGNTPVASLAPLEGLPLVKLQFGSTKVTDLKPILGMPLKDVQVPGAIRDQWPALRAVKTLETINGKPATEFWKEYDAKK
jgi:serine/threonine protein kinase